MRSPTQSELTIQSSASSSPHPPILVGIADEEQHESENVAAHITDLPREVLTRIFGYLKGKVKGKGKDIYNCSLVCTDFYEPALNSMDCSGVYDSELLMAAAFNTNNYELVRYWNNRHVSISQAGLRRLCEACQDQDIEMVKFFLSLESSSRDLELSAGIRYCPEEFYFVSLIHSTPPVQRALYLYCPQISCENFGLSRFAPIMLAIMNGRKEVLKLLLERIDSEQRKRLDREVFDNAVNIWDMEIREMLSIPTSNRRGCGPRLFEVPWF